MGKVIDILAVIALIAGTATTFSIATPLLSMILTNLFGITASKYLSIGILVVVCGIYTTSVMNGLKGVNMLSKICMILFGIILAYVFILGGEARFSIETGVTSLGNMVQNFFGLSTWTDATRTEAGFAQNWTIFYWAYWMVWCVASPFFMGSISRGPSYSDLSARRTIVSSVQCCWSRVQLVQTLALRDLTSFGYMA